MAKYLALLFSVGCAAWVGCSPSGPEALMSAGDVRKMPWPSDALMVNGKVKVAPPFPFDGNEDNLQRLGVALSELDGFGTVTSIFFPVSADVKVDANAYAEVIDLDGKEQTRQFPLRYRAETKQLIAMSPIGTVLTEHHRYACVIRRGVNVHASDAMQKVIDQNVKGGALAATVFTTRTVSNWFASVELDANPKAHVTRTFMGTDLDDLFGGPVTTTLPGFPPSGGVLHDQIGVAYEGTFSSPNYLSNPPGSLGLFSDPPVKKSTDDIPFLLVMPKGRTSAPVIIFQHGIGSDRSAILLVANDYAARGYAIFGIDELWHGSRQPGAVDKVNNISGAQIPDGIGDSGGGAINNFFDVVGDASQNIAALDPRVMRDNFRQASIDLMQAVRVAKSGDWSDAGVTLDGSKIVYTGESFGSILGAMVMALDPEVETGVLDVGGGGLFLDLIGNSASFAQLLQPFVAGGFDQLFDVNNPTDNPIRQQMSLNLMQTLFESGDGLPLAQAATSEKKILFLEAFNDEVVANHSTEALANAWGVTQVVLSSGSPPTRVVMLPKTNAPAMLSRALVQLDPACHGMFTRQKDQRKYQDGFPPFMKRDQPLPVDNPIARAHALALDFIDSVRAGTPTVPSD
jgi:dienelactone hydrolase